MWAKRYCITWLPMVTKAQLLESTGSCSVLPPRQTWTGFPRTQNREVSLSFAFRPAKRAVLRWDNTALIPPGHRIHPFPCFLPSFLPSVHPSRARHSAPRAPAGTAELGPRRNRGHVRAPPPAVSRAPAGPRRPRRRALTAGGPGRAGHRDRRDTGSRSAATAAAVAECFDVSEAVARPAPGAVRLRGLHPRPPGRGREQVRWVLACRRVLCSVGIKLAGCARFKISPGFWVQKYARKSMRLGVWGGHWGVHKK